MAQEPINAHSHLLSVLIGNTQTVPVTGGKLCLGTWQVCLWGGKGGGGTGGDLHVSGRAIMLRNNGLCLCGGRSCQMCSKLRCEHHKSTYTQSVLLVELDGPRLRTVGVQLVGIMQADKSEKKVR